MNARLSNLTAIVLVLSCAPVGSAQNDLKDARELLGSVPAKFREYDVILEPDKNEPEWWAGAASVVRDKKGTFRLACRMRTADSPRGNEIRLFRLTP